MVWLNHIDTLPGLCYTQAQGDPNMSNSWIYLVVRCLVPGMEPHHAGVRRAFTTQEAAITYRDEMARLCDLPTHRYVVQPWRLEGPIGLASSHAPPGPGFMQAAS